MQEQHDSTPPVAPSHYEHPEPSKLRHSDTSSEYSSVSDWIPYPAVTSAPPPSDRSDPNTTSEGSSRWTESTGDSQERRRNPKLTKSRAGSRAVSILSEEPGDSLVVDYKYRVHTKQLGHLFGLCDAVPYLLGPRSYLRAIVAFGNYPVPVEAYLDQEGNYILDPKRITASDKVFMMMLWLLRAPVDRRPVDWEDLYAGMSVQEDRLIVYKDVGFGREPKVDAMHFDEFLSMAVDWKHLPNPALVAEDRPDVVTSWAIIADKIREHNIPIEEIDKALYTELVGLTEEQAECRVIQLSTTNELEQRKKEIAENALKLKSTNTFTYIMPQETNPTVMYSKRFSHQYPRGYLLDTTTPGHDDLLFPEAKMKQDAEELRKEREDKKGKKMADKARKRAKYRCTKFCQWFGGILLLLGVAAAFISGYYFNRADNSSRQPK